MGSKKFDKFINSFGEPMTLRPNYSTGIVTKELFTRGAPDQKFYDDNISFKELNSGYSGENFDLNEKIKSLPVGSRISLTNLEAKSTDAFRNENLVKLGDDLWGAHGFDGKTFSLQEITYKFASITQESPSESYIQKNVFISNIETYKEPEQ
jgi:hypothetical protein